jgi:hypothetical protein
LDDNKKGAGRASDSGSLAMGESQPVLDRLEGVVEDLAVLQSKLALLVGPPGAGKTALLRALAERHGATIFNVGAELAARLAALPQRQRALDAPDTFRELAEGHAGAGLLLIDKIELLFDHSLQLDPLDLVKRQARLLPVVAVWPGELRHGRLIYAEIGHPEYRDYGLEGLVPFEVELKG